MNNPDSIDLVVGWQESLRVTPGEQAVLATAPIQRMARLRQTGLGYLSAPTCEHTRLAHCLGTTYWTERMFAHLQASDRSGTISELDAQLGSQGATIRVARLFALVHDCSLLPLGHTVAHQLGFSSPRTSVMKLLLDRVERIREECRTSKGWHSSDAAAETRILKDLDWDLTRVQWAIAVSQLAAGKAASYTLQSGDRTAFLKALPALWIINDVVTGPLGADLFDYALRDLGALSLDFAVSPALLDSLRMATWQIAGNSETELQRYLDVEELPDVLRLAVNLTPEVAPALQSTLTSRFLLAKHAWFHPGKLTTDAMLDVALRRIDSHTSELSTFSGTFDPQRLLELGDDEFLRMLVPLEAACLMPGEEAVLPRLLRRQFYESVYEVLPDSLSLQPQFACRLSAPAERNRIQNFIREEVGNSHLPIAIASVPADGQFKEADILVLDAQGEARILEEWAGSGDPAAESLAPIAALRDQYAGLWSASILAPPFCITPRLKQAAANLFAGYFENAAATA